MDMNVYEEIKSIVHKNNNLAYIIGNGINSRYFSNNVPDWKSLLSDLWKEIYNEDIKVPEGITYTEFFDLIELKSLYSNITNVSATKEFAIKDLPKDLRERYKDLVVKTHNDRSLETIVNRFKKENDTFLDLSRKFCKSIREDADELSNIDVVNYIIGAISEGSKINIYKNELKKKVVEKYSYNEVSGQAEYVNIIDSIRNSNNPILTTNFDSLMSTSLDLKMYKMGEHFTDFYPWNVYFSDIELQNSNDGFAIWHINGLINYHRSIKLGLSDYMGCVERARKMLQGKDLIEYFNGKNQNNWAGYNTWLHIVFNRDLFIFGLALDENEVFLRWLLIQRAKYSRMYSKFLKGWYVDVNISPGKRLFLEKIGFNVIELKSFDEFNLLYNAIISK